MTSSVRHSMVGLHLEEPGSFQWRTVPVPIPNSDEVLVQVLFSGIYGTDLHAFRGAMSAIFSYPRRLGHELSVRPVNGDQDSHYALNPYLNCDRCQPCWAGQSNCCENLKVMGVHCDGGFAPYLVVPAAHLYPSRILSGEVMALVEPLVVGRHAVKRAKIQSGETALIVGLGPIGISVALFAKEAGANLIVCEAREDRRIMAQKILDTDQVLIPGQNARNDLRRAMNGGLPSVVFDATGNKNAMEASFDLAANGGRCVLVGHYTGNYTFRENLFHKRELTLLASRNGLPEDFEAVIEALENGSVNGESLITHRFYFSDVPENFPQLATRPGLIKAMVKIT